MTSSTRTVEEEDAKDACGLLPTTAAHAQKFLEYCGQAEQLWDALRVYEHAANRITLPPGSVHLDIGSGTGKFLSVLASGSPDSLVIGVDRCPLMQQEAARRLQAAGTPPVAVVSHVTERLDEQGLPHRSYAFPDEDQYLGSLEKGIVLVTDSVRSAQVVRQVLGGRKVSSASLLFPGSGEDRLLLEAPLSAEEYEHSRPVRLARLEEKINNQTDAAVYSLLEDVMEQDGKFLLVQRSDFNAESLYHPQFRSLLRRWFLDVLSDISASFQLQECGLLAKNISVRERQAISVKEFLRRLYRDDVRCVPFAMLQHHS